MTQPDTLHTRLRDEIHRRLAVARAASPGPWTWDEDRNGEAIGGGDPDSPDVALVYSHYDEDHGIPLGPTDGPYVALHGPADAIRRYTAALARLDEHTPIVSPYRESAGITVCARCGELWGDCTEWPRLLAEYPEVAHRLRIDTEERRPA